MNDNKMTISELSASWSLGTVISLRMLGMFMVLPVLTTEGMKLSGANESLIGLAIGIYGLTQAVFQIPLGLLSDRLGRKPIIIGGLLIFIIGSTIAATTSSIWGLIIGRAVQGAGAISAAVMALLSDLIREQNRTKAMACIGISIGITFTIAMVAGPIITHHLNFNALFWLISMLAILAIVITLLAVPSVKYYTFNRETSVVKSSIRLVLSNINLIKLDASIFILHALLMLNFITLPKQLVQSGLPLDKHWEIYLSTMLISFLSIMPLIFLAEEKHCIKWLFIFGIITLIIAEIIFLSADNHLWILVSGSQIFFLAFNLIEAILPSLISKESPLGYKGTAMGIYSTSQFLGIAIGGSLGGILLGYLGYKMVFICGIILSIIWLMFIITIREPPYVSSLRFIIKNIDLFSNKLDKYLIEQKGVLSTLIIPEEECVYIKIDTKLTNRTEIEKRITSLTYKCG
ncbi:MFS transporter [Candidatus Ishikawella capsulata]|uniref:Predicted transporter MFS family n=1 Tax=Candidatus Ishikawaella capsulata Mpkobe TaxID=476281 RepID=C5WCZ9_9ENTR|nr:MFS transporter [Candidatus Ishikawaella capsulata]BAH83205.1 predicted transporter MFS family [Candidatus Ishikawaella capsulata Mpkobe]